MRKVKVQARKKLTYNKHNTKSTGGAKAKIDSYQLRETYTEIFGKLTKAKVNRLLIYFSVISILEILAYLYKGVFSLLAVRGWVITGFLCLVTIFVYFIQTVILDIKEKRFLSLAAVFLLFLLLITICKDLNLTDINPDATQQAAAGLDSFQIRDFNYTGKAFLGYPNRQYLLSAAPALIFGRSIFSLHMGFAWPFILGLMLLYSSLCKWARLRKLNSSISVLPLYAFFVFPFVTEYYTNFEQAIYPISFTMVGIGFFLLFLCEANVFNIIGLAWIGGLFSNSYTPGLATLGLFLVFVGIVTYLLYNEPNKLPFQVISPVLVAKALLMVEINSIIVLFATFLDKRQDKVTELRNDVDVIKLTFSSIYHFLTDKDAKFLGMFGVVVITYLLASLTFRLKVRDFLISLWILGVVVASNLMTGYTSYEPSWIMQRMMVVIPVIITAITLTVFDVISKNKLKVVGGVVAVTVVTFAFIGLFNIKQINQSFVYFNYIQPMKYMWEDLEDTVKAEGLEEESEFNLILYTDNILMKNPSDYCKFFYPNAKVYIPDQGTYPSDMDTNLSTIIYGEYELSPYSSGNQIEVKIFENKKHDMVVTWFKGIIRK